MVNLFSDLLFFSKTCTDNGAQNCTDCDPAVFRVLSGTSCICTSMLFEDD